MVALNGNDFSALQADRLRANEQVWRTQLPRTTVAASLLRRLLADTHAVEQSRHSRKVAVANQLAEPRGEFQLPRQSSLSRSYRWEPGGRSLKPARVIFQRLTTTVHGSSAGRHAVFSDLKTAPRRTIAQTAPGKVWSIISEPRAGASGSVGPCRAARGGKIASGLQEESCRHRSNWLKAVVTARDVCWHHGELLHAASRRFAAGFRVAAHSTAECSATSLRFFLLVLAGGRTT